ncbi:uncharacterized protein LOC127568696 isoform X2 [Pristis pectinata]|uniref:uncharacterized protein LOC127568696 isoform X2 n=1 Tax=Pristis pectinata TaxID=685728 RepID=UPI00223CBB4D|nr:uncharacterized protein LOC127568696 isoform X2 [Pristis pectinata]
MAPPLILGAETWSMSGGTHVVSLDLVYALSLLLLILLLVSCGNCMRSSGQFSTDSNYMQSKDSSQLIRVTQLDDVQYPKIICKPTLRGSLHSRKVSWQNDMHVTGSPPPGSAQQSRALPEIPGGPACQEDSDGKGDPVYQTASELAAPCQCMEEEPMDQPYAASSQFGVETPTAELVIEDEAGGEEDRRSGKVTAVYARVSKKLKNPPGSEPPLPSSAPGNLEPEDLPPPVPEKLFGDGDIMVSESPGNQRWEQSGSQMTEDPSPEEGAPEEGAYADPVQDGCSG